MGSQDALFDIPDRPRREASGRTGETYTRTVVAEVAVDHSRALRDAALAVFDQTTFIDIGPIADAYEDADEDGAVTRDDVRDTDSAALIWLIEPSERILPLLEAHAVKLDSAEVSAEEVAPARLRLTLTVTVTIENLTALREIALAHCPESDHHARREIGSSIAAAWYWATDTDDQLHAVPGISVKTFHTEVTYSADGS